ncbi:hypothetical protein LSI54_09580 [Nesterenkonia sp. AY15]|uniref:hypothetical protein n=1 Tax=Nesterenkonia sp. AY15 TaxID=2901139 RepID=UPI001F4C8301|nr:hypothetical protein [Nesterenkonia sp. AY15]MCH8571602.1 hypothetical protein [Nesterenkonia sp. AY15]
MYSPDGTRIDLCRSMRSEHPKIGWVCRTDRCHLDLACLRAAWKSVSVPGPFPADLLDDAVRLASKSETRVTVDRIAKDFGVHPMTMQTWLNRAETQSGAKPGQTGGEAAELGEARKRTPLLEHEVEVLRRATAPAPAVRETRS